MPRSKGADAAPKRKGGLRERQKEYTRSVLLTAAIDVFTEHGYAGATIEQIAVAAGTSRPTFYQYFPSKADIALELLEDLRRDFDAVFASLFELEAPTRHEIQLWVERAVKVWYPLNPRSTIIAQARAVEPELADAGNKIVAENLERVAKYLRSQQPSLSVTEARVYACHLIAVFEMITYSRMFDIPATTRLISELIVDSWSAVLEGPRPKAK